MLRYHGETRENGVLAAVFLLCGMIFLMGVTEQEQTLQQQLAQQILRLRVIASDDSAQAQEQKYQVCDAVTAVMNPLLKNCRTRSETREMVQKLQPDIIRAAKEASGISDIQVELRQDWFPVRTWGSYTIPEGNYETLHIQIGEGKGHNWWTVLYPANFLSEAVHPVFTGEEGNCIEQMFGEDLCDFISYPAKTKIRFRWLGLEFFSRNR